MENKKRNSGMRWENWVAKGMTEEEAKFKVKSFRKFNKEYWLIRGFSEEEAREKIKELQSELNTRATSNRKKNPEQYKGRYPTSIEYWLKKYDLETALIKLKEYQTKFSKDVCISRYGETDGLMRWTNRQTKWQNTLNEKTEEEKSKINKKKDCVSTDFFIRKGFSNNDAINENEKAKIKRMVKFNKASNESLRIFKPLYEALIVNGFSDNDIYFGYANKKEWFISSRNYFYSYDFTIKSKKMIIEYNGSKFHYNPNMHDENWRGLYSNCTPNESLKYDEQKKQVAKDHGFDVYTIWDTDNEQTINKLIDKLFHICNVL